MSENKIISENRFFTIFKYLFFGGSAFIIDFGILYIFKSFIGFSAWSSSIVAFVISTIYAYFTQMRYTFSHKMKSVSPIIKYCFLLVFNMVFTAFVVQVFDSFSGLYLLGKVVATICVVVWNFPIMKHFIFPKNM